MEFDYGTAVRHEVYAEQDDSGRLSNRVVEREQNEWHGWGAEVQTSAPSTASFRARDLFAEGSCAWTEYYADQNILDKVGTCTAQTMTYLGGTISPRGRRG